MTESVEVPIGILWLAVTSFFIVGMCVGAALKDRETEEDCEDVLGI